MSTEEFSKIENQMTRIWMDAGDDGSVEYASENDVAIVGGNLVKYLSRAMGLELRAFTEVGTFGLRLDVWLQCATCFPLG
jgi:hypothetical protein